MISPLIVEEVRLKLAAGVHVTKAGGAKLSVGVVNASASGERSVPLAFGFMDSPGTQWAGAEDLRELSEVFAKMAGALEAK